MTPRPSPEIDRLDGDCCAGPDVHRHYDRLRENAPVFYDEKNVVWGLRRYERVTYASKTPRVFCSSRGTWPPRCPSC